MACAQTGSGKTVRGRVSGGRVSRRGEGEQEGGGWGLVHPGMIGQDNAFSSNWEFPVELKFLSFSMR